VLAAACGGGGTDGGTEPGTAPAAINTVSSLPTSAPVGSVVSTPLTVIVNDTKGKPMASVVVTFRVTAGNGTLSAGAATTNGGGQASTNFTLGSAAGTNEVTASVTGVSATAKFLITGIPSSACTTPTAMTVGQVVTDITTACIGGSTSQDYAAIVVGMSPTATSKTSVELAGSSLGTPPAAFFSLANTLPSANLSLGGYRANVMSNVGEVAFLEQTTREFAPLVSGARRWYASRSSLGRSPGPSSTVVPVGASAKVGDVFALNLGGFGNNQGCSATAAVSRNARVVAVGTKSIVMADTANPPSDVSASDFQLIADQFDAIIDPLDRAAFGDPTDIDGNGKVVIVFTRSVNERSSPNKGISILGLTHSRDLAPVAQCAGSNQSEMFYMIAADTGGFVGGNKVSRDALMRLTPSTIVHEYQHLINFARRIYINNASIEDVWLNEGLSHEAEELLFFRVSGFSPRANIGATSITTQQQADAFNVYFIGDFGLYDEYLGLTSVTSPYMPDDSLATRGATQFFLRYAADRVGTSDGNIWFRLANGPAVGRANLRAVFGVDDAGLQAMFRDFAVSTWVDDFITVESRYTQLSWNIRSIYTALRLPDGSRPPFPLVQPGLADGAPASITLNGGSFAVYRFSTVAGANATLRLTGTGGTGLPVGALVTLAIIRTR
jgi:hypothetical protein